MGIVGRTSQRVVQTIHCDALHGAVFILHKGVTETKGGRMKESEKKPALGSGRDETAVGSSHAESHAWRSDGLAADEQIRMRAYELYRERGGKVGDDMTDWLRAEREYLEVVPRTTSAGPAGQPASRSGSPANRA
jgi:hypothetical protein